jgi:hypothetical protein
MLPKISSYVYRLKYLRSSVADPHHLEADLDPDPACHFDADPDLDPTFPFDVIPEPSFQIKAQNLEKVLQ